MKRLFVLVTLPLVVFALERVNLIRDHSFEKDSEVWKCYDGGDGSQDSAIASRHDSERALNGMFSASSDTRKTPGSPSFFYDDSALVMQGFSYPKVVADIDSLEVYYSILPVDNDFERLASSFIALYIEAGKPTYLSAGYYIKAEDIVPSPPEHMVFLGSLNFPSDTGWYVLSKTIQDDLDQRGIPLNAKVDSIFVMGWGGYLPPWRGQKIYWDAIRLTGYADYDVGVKEILSGDSVWAGVYYKPVARIKNFGRQAADDFLAIAEIRQGETLVWADTIPYTLPGDTEDTLEFDSFPIPNALSYTLTVRTEMSPDECDEDDQVSQTLFGTAVAEPVTHPDAITLEVNGFGSKGVLRVAYSLPQGQQGTISIYDAAGRRLESLKVQGSGEVRFPSALSSGVYFITLEAEKTSLTRKAVVLR